MASRDESREVQPEHRPSSRPPREPPLFGDPRSEDLVPGLPGHTGSAYRPISENEGISVEADEEPLDGGEHDEIPITVFSDDGSHEGSDVRQEAVAKARDQVIKGLTEIEAHLQDQPFFEAWKVVAEATDSPPDSLNDVLETVGLLKRTADEMPEAGPDHVSSLGLEAVTAASVAEGGLAEMQDTAASVESPSGKIVSKTLAWVMKRWPGIARWLWKLISSLLTPRQWSLTGGIELPGLGNASISITFGG
jgi:hypothetical protein